MRFLIITGMGRSGSTFLAELLSHAANAEARHEHLGGKHVLSLSYYRPDHPYLTHELSQNRRQVERDFPGVQTFVDVNPYLRYSLDAVRQALDQPRIYHLVREGRKVISSMYLRKTYTPRENKLPIMPLDTEQFAAWDGYSRFEKLCWYWRDTIERMFDAQLPILKLEDITRDFALLKHQLLDPEGIELSQQTWQTLRDKPVNTNRFKLKYLIRGRPEKVVWNAETEQRFQAICGETMAALGYER